MKSPCILIFLYLLTFACFQSSAQSASEEFFKVTEEEIYSSYLNEERRFWVYTPLSYDDESGSYPVVFVTDGWSHLFHMSGIMEFLSRNERMPESILVAIPHFDRNSDLLPVSTTGSQFSGNADNFLNFIQHEVIPYLDQNYQTHPFKVLSGHSFGGLFATYGLVSRHDAFNAFIAADPSLWWDNRWLQVQLENLLSQNPDLERYYYFDQSEIRTMGGIEMDRMLETLAPELFQWEFEYMPEETHGSIVHKSYYNGLEFVFSNWPYQEITMTPSGGLVSETQSVSLNMHVLGGGSIHYTTDGSVPNTNSPVYSAPIEIRSAGTVRASVVLSNDRISIPTQAVFGEAVLFAAVDVPDDLQAGLRYELFEGYWNEMPDFSMLAAVESGVMDAPSIRNWINEDQFALKFTGYIEIPEEGIYGFSLSSDDGSMLYIDEVGIINNDGIHGDEAQDGWAYLAAGMHQVEIQFFERTGEEAFRLYYTAPGSTNIRNIPNDWWFH